MPCYSPISGYICQDGKFRQTPNGPSRPQTVSCGSCIGCRLKKSVEWAIRITHEASLYRENSFITLTYSPEHVPKDYSLHYIHFQDFMKRLRERCRGSDEVPHPSAGLPDGKHGGVFPDFYRPIRFYMAGEYGDDFGRPHFHACLFNIDFYDKKPFKKLSSGSTIYRSKLLEELWPYGYSSTGDVSFESAAYVARYVTKKITGKPADDHYQWVDDDGVVTWRTPEFCRMSLKPGIAYGWISKFMSDVYPNDYVILKGKKRVPPRYYDKIYERFDSQESYETFVNSFDPIKSKTTALLPDVVSYSPLFEALKSNRQDLAREYLLDNTPERRLTKSQVAEANLNRFKRNLKL